MTKNRGGNDGSEKMNRKNTAATDRLIEAVQVSYEHGMRTVIRLANVTLWWEGKWLVFEFSNTFLPCTPVKCSYVTNVMGGAFTILHVST